MSEQRQIKIKIDPLGNPVIEAVGFNGMGCEAATAGLEQALSGGGGLNRTLKPEAYNAADTAQEQHQSW
jgi:hypothetical protein